MFVTSLNKNIDRECATFRGGPVIIHLILSLVALFIAYENTRVVRWLSSGVLHINGATIHTLTVYGNKSDFKKIYKRKCT